MNTPIEAFRHCRAIDLLKLEEWGQPSYLAAIEAILMAGRVAERLGGRMYVEVSSRTLELIIDWWSDETSRQYDTAKVWRSSITLPRDYSRNPQEAMCYVAALLYGVVGKLTSQTIECSVREAGKPQ